MFDSRPQPTDQRQRLAAALRTHFGLCIDRYPPALVKSMLTSVEKHQFEPNHLFTAFSIGETTFFRHPEQFRFFADAIGSLPGPRTGEGLRIWSAGCASGEEAYSLAFTLHKAGFPTAEIIGTELNDFSIERAKAATYRSWSLRGVAPEQMSLLEQSGVEFRVPTAIRRMVRFEKLNLAHDPFPRNLDAIFCRNVLMYFCPEACERVLEQFQSSLRPGGLLFLGYADSEPSNRSLWERLPPGAGPCFRRLNVTSVELDSAVPVVQQNPRPQAIPLWEAPQHSTTSTIQSPHPAAGDRHATVLVQAARGLTAQGNHRGALELLRNAKAEGHLDPSLHVLTSIVADDAGEHELALEAARRAAMLAPQEPVPQFFLGACLLRAGEAGLAMARFQVCRLLLLHVKKLDQPLPYGEGLTASQLQRVLDLRSMDAPHLKPHAYPALTN